MDLGNYSKRTQNSWHPSGPWDASPVFLPPDASDHHRVSAGNAADAAPAQEQQTDCLVLWLA
eukprot:1370316-Pyramimonas_sp.AAC.1